MDTIGSELGNHFILLGYLFIGDLSWHELRDEVGFPYTMEERIKDSYYYEPQGTKDGLMVYTSKQDPNATAIDLIDAVYGEFIPLNKTLSLLSSGLSFIRLKMYLLLVWSMALHMLKWGN